MLGDWRELDDSWSTFDESRTNAPNGRDPLLQERSVV